jgi:hypothetical protein
MKPDRGKGEALLVFALLGPSWEGAVIVQEAKVGP